MSAGTTRAALESGVLALWRAENVSPANSATARRLAFLAVEEVVDALRQNPAWARSIGIEPSPAPRSARVRR